MTADLAARLETAQSAAREAGKFALAMFQHRETLEVMSKGPQDRVTIADRNAENIIRDRIAAEFPSDNILGEEFGHGGGEAPAGENLWVVDPIDGTDCFVFGLPMWSVSVAWMEDGMVKVGAIYDPVHDEMYAASLDGGAFLNGDRLKASPASEPTDGLVGIGHSLRVDRADTLAALDRLMEMGGIFHRCGSGALSIAWVAAGRLIAYYEPHINAWDCLAGLLLVTEAGGWTNDFLANDGLVSGNPVLASGPGMVDHIRTVAGLAGEAGGETIPAQP